MKLPSVKNSVHACISIDGVVLFVDFVFTSINYNIRIEYCSIWTIVCRKNAAYFGGMK